MKLILTFFFIFFLSCDKKSSNYNEENEEFAEQMETDYFDNEKKIFSLNATIMKKDSKVLNLNFMHSFYCINENYFFEDTIYKILD